MRSALFLTSMFVAAAFAGCAENPGVDNPTFSLNRQIRFHIDNQNVQSDSQDPYDFVEAVIVVTLGEVSVPAALTVAYQDRSGNFVTKPLTAFTTLTSLPKGSEIRIEDANITSGAELYSNGLLVASRQRPHVDWWNIGGYPIGWRMEPGAGLSFATAGSMTESFRLQDITSEAADVVLEQATASLSVSYDGTLDLDFRDAPETLQAESSHTARPLAWDAKGNLRVPVLIEATGRNLTSGETVTAGLEVLPGTKADFGAHGKLWWNASNSPVRMDVDGGQVNSAADIIAWISGVDAAADFSCAGKTRADECRPTEFKLEETTTTETIEPSKENLDTFPWDIDHEIVSNLTRVLDEDLRPGDELRFDVDVDSRAFPDYDADDGPDFVSVRGGALLRVVAYEPVTVRAGTFDAIKVTERVDLRVEAGPTRGDDGAPVFDAFTIDQKFVETTFWLAQDTFIPLRIEQTSPVDVDALLDVVLNSAGESLWETLPVSRLRDENVEVTVEARSSLELTRAAGTSYASPWAVLIGFHGLAGLPGMLIASSAAGAAQPAFPDEQWYDDYPRDVDYGGDGYDFPHGDPASITLSLQSASAVSADGTTKDLEVDTVSDDAWWSQIEVMLDGESLTYADGWCVLSDEVCDEYGVYGPILEGDVLRITGDGLAGREIVLVDAASGSIVFVMTLG